MPYLIFVHFKMKYCSDCMVLIIIKYLLIIYFYNNLNREL